MMKIEKKYDLVKFAELSEIACPCGITKRAFIKESNGRCSFHIVKIKKTAELHYHKQHTEIYYIMKGIGFLELDGEKIPVSPGDSVIIHPDCRHRAIGNLKIINISLPAFDMADEWFDE